ncbi:hypothetical protein [Salipiger mucosus]|uniref:Uncharacterized protein n=1 Tax=Salipiger mucosus DSM 16094 TaxID=1123237 RepID=S9RCN5_9RHOB|nr:hypothetical protein [Salipiger mucosus]EPX75890.1 hypothetical protein Salmuc_00993 [Salipiger mucosus DSM 16094]
MRRIDEKLAKIAGGDYAPQDFLLVFAKDADLLRGCAAPGRDAQGRMRPLSAYLDDVQRVIDADLADILLTSLSTAEALADRAAFGRRNVTPAVRFNDATDAWRVRGGRYAQEPARAFRSSRLDAVRPVANLGLYALSFYNDAELDHATLRAYSDFRDVAVTLGLRHFLQVADPPFAIETGTQDYAAYRNDMVARSLAGIGRKERPVFVTVGYHGAAATEELARWDPARLVVGLTAARGGTLRDSLERLAQAERHGARLAVVSRESLACEDPVLLLQAMRRVLRDRLGSFEAVRAYHDDLAKAGIPPLRALQDDAELTDPVLKAHEIRAA